MTACDLRAGVRSHTRVHSPEGLGAEGAAPRFPGEFRVFGHTDNAHHFLIASMLAMGLTLLWLATYGATPI